MSKLPDGFTPATIQTSNNIFRNNIANNINDVSSNFLGYINRSYWATWLNLQALVISLLFWPCLHMFVPKDSIMDYNEMVFFHSLVCLSGSSYLLYDTHKNLRLAWWKGENYKKPFMTVLMIFASTFFLTIIHYYEVSCFLCSLSFSIFSSHTTSFVDSNHMYIYLYIYIIYDFKDWEPVVFNCICVFLFVYVVVSGKYIQLICTHLFFYELGSFVWITEHLFQHPGAWEGAVGVWLVVTRLIWCYWCVKYVFLPYRRGEVQRGNVVDGNIENASSNNFNDMRVTMNFIDWVCLLASIFLCISCTLYSALHLIIEVDTMEVAEVANAPGPAFVNAPGTAQ